MPYTVYILRTSSNTLYIGQTNNIERRLKEHQAKSSKSAKYIRYFATCNLVHSEIYNSRSEAIKRERELKNAEGYCGESWNCQKHWESGLWKGLATFSCSRSCCNRIACNASNWGLCWGRSSCGKSYCCIRFPKSWSRSSAQR